MTTEYFWHAADFIRMYHYYIWHLQIQAIVQQWVELSNLMALIFDIKVEFLEMNEISFEVFSALYKHPKNPQGRKKKAVSHLAR